MARQFACILLVLVGVLGLRKPALAEGPIHPLIMLTEYNPWAMVLGSDTPSFALYDDGTLIYWGERNKTKQYLSVKLGGEDAMSLLKSIKPEELAKVESSYELVQFTDAPTNVLVFWTPGPNGNKKVSVYGPLRGLSARPEALPEVLWSALRLLLSYDNPNATPWTPAYVEVMLWPFEYAKESVTWPATWPGLSDSKTRKRKGLYSIFIQGSHLEEIKAFMSRLGPKQAVKLDNKKWAMDVRFPFPHEIR